MTSSILKTRQTKYAAYLTVYILVVLAVLGAMNFLAQRYNKSYDSTSNKRFSLSDQTEKVVKELQRDVTLTYYDQTRNFSNPTGGARDLLDRYDNLSTRLKIVYVDPDRKPALAKEAGITRLGTLIVDSGTKREEAKSITEEEVTSALIRSLKEGDRTVCFVSGSGEHGTDDTERTGYSAAKEELEKNNYKTEVISLLEKAEVPEACTVLAVAGPRFDYPAPVVEAIKTYVETKGGRALLMVNPPLSLGRTQTSANLELSKLIATWGVVLNSDLVLDTSGIGQIFGLSEVVPLVTEYDTHPIVKPMSETATAFPLARSIEVGSADKVTVEKLFSTTKNSFATNNLSAAEIRMDPARDKRGPFTLAAAGTYKGEPEGRFVVVGSSGFIANNILRFNGNRDLFLNIVNWLSSDEDLISIRPKDPEDRRLTLNRSQMSTIFFGSVIGLPLMILGSGLLVWWKRR